MRGLSDETIDGMIFESQLAANPEIIARRDRFWKKVEAIKATTLHLTKAQMVDGLKRYWSAYQVHLLERSSEHDLRDRITMIIANTSDGERLRDILNLPKPKPKQESP